MDAQPTRDAGQQVNPPVIESPPVPLIVVLDDERTIVQAVAILIEDMGLRAFEATKGQDALLAMHAEWPNVVITDLMMPLMSGAQFLARVRQLSSTNGLPVPRIIVMTAGGTHGQEDLHADEIVHKPFDLSRMEEAIKRVMG